MKALMSRGANRVSLIFFASTILFSSHAHAQGGTQETARRLTWYEGEVVLQDSTLLCKLQYDDFTGILKYKAHDTPNEVRTKKAGGISRFDYFDADDRRRIFIPVPFDVNGNGTMTPVFFEVLKEYKHFALVSGKLPLEILKSVNPGAVRGYGQALSTFFQQREIVCIIDDSGNVRPYLQLTYSVTKRGTSAGHGQILNEDVLKHYLGTAYPQIEELADEHKLSFKKKEDLMEIFEYYDKIKGD